MNDKDVLEYLREWYRKNKNSERKWSNNELGIGLKKMMKLLKHWKDKPRGKPEKGLRKMLENRRLKNQSEVENSQEEF